MTVSFRNIDASPSDPVATWPFEGLVIVLERGLVADWQPLITEVRHHPWGVTARRVESYVGYAAPSPVTRLFSLVLERARGGLGVQRPLERERLVWACACPARHRERVRA